jgi:hypothetical protein
MTHIALARMTHRSLAALLLLLAGAMPLAGCAGLLRPLAHSSDLTLRSRDAQGAQMRGDFATGVYRCEDESHATLILWDGAENDPTQAVVIRVFWVPLASRTPIDPDATNASIQYVVFGGAQRQLVGVYAGAGYVYPHGELGNASLSAGVWQADLLLGDSSDGFRDLLGPAALEGKVRVRRDDAEAVRLLRQLGVVVSQKLGYPRLVGRLKPGKTSG